MVRSLLARSHWSCFLAFSTSDSFCLKTFSCSLMVEIFGRVKWQTKGSTLYIQVVQAVSCLYQCPIRVRCSILSSNCQMRFLLDCLQFFTKWWTPPHPRLRRTEPLEDAFFILNHDTVTFLHWTSNYWMIQSGGQYSTTFPLSSPWWYQTPLT